MQKRSWLLLAALVAYLYWQGKVDPPQPEPQPNPPTPDIVAPIQADGLRVLVVEQTNPRSPTTALVVDSGAWQDYVKGKGGYFRRYDMDMTDEQLKYEERKEFVTAFKRPRAKVPWVVVSNGKTGVETVLPETPQAMLELVKQYGDQL